MRGGHLIELTEKYFMLQELLQVNSNDEIKLIYFRTDCQM